MALQVLQEDSDGEEVAQPSRAGGLFARAANAPFPGKQHRSPDPGESADLPFDMSYGVFWSLLRNLHRCQRTQPYAGSCRSSLMVLR